MNSFNWMPEDDGIEMGRYRAIMTDTDREHISGKSDPSQDQKDQAVYRVRQRITGELPRDISILEEHRPDVLDELRDVVCEKPRIADGLKSYVAVKDHPETGEDEIVFDDEPIEHVAYDGSGGDTLKWGYTGAGPTNTARSILEHALDELEFDSVSISHNDQVDFRQEFIQNQGGEGWAIPFSTVENWIRLRYGDLDDL